MKTLVSAEETLGAEETHAIGGVDDPRRRNETLGGTEYFKEC